jgi:hypothetical protein
VKRLGLQSAGYRSSHKCRVSWFTVLHLSSSLVHLGGDEAKSIFVELGPAVAFTSSLLGPIKTCSINRTLLHHGTPPAATGDRMCIYYLQGYILCPALLLTHALFTILFARIARPSEPICIAPHCIPQHRPLRTCSSPSRLFLDRRNILRIRPLNFSNVRTTQEHLTSAHCHRSRDHKRTWPVTFHLQSGTHLIAHYFTEQQKTPAPIQSTTHHHGRPQSRRRSVHDKHQRDGGEHERNVDGINLLHRDQHGHLLEFMDSEKYWRLCRNLHFPHRSRHHLSSCLHRQVVSRGQGNRIRIEAKICRCRGREWHGGQDCIRCQLNDWHPHNKRRSRERPHSPGARQTCATLPIRR